VNRQQRPQQSGFTGGRSTLDAILSLRLLSKVPKKIQPLHRVYVDLKDAFESLDRGTLWKAMQGKGTEESRPPAGVSL